MRGRVSLRHLALTLALVTACAPVPALATLAPSAAPSDTPPPTPTSTQTPVASLAPTPSPSASPTAGSTTTPTPSTRSAAPTVIVSGELASSTAPRAAADAASAKNAADAVRALAVDLYHEVATPGKNLVFSPYSAAAALAMTRVGARGDTARQMDTVLHRALAGDIDAAFNALDLELAKRAAGPSAYGHLPLQLTTANRLWAQRDLRFATPFLDRIAAYYGAGVGLVDYVNARETARRTINAWVSDRTHALIPELVKQDMLDELTRFVLTNALYFKAQWFIPFPKNATASGPFFKLDGAAVEAQLMKSFGYTGYAKGAGYQAVSRAYASDLSMVVVVPDRGTFTEFERGLDAAKLTSINDALVVQALDLAMPKFTFRSTALLDEALIRLGMPIAFTDRADFSGITVDTQLQLQHVAQETFIAVDEEGTEAAAATAVIGGATGGPAEWVTLKIDRPFVFLIKDDATGAILFMGRVLDPSG